MLKPADLQEGGLYYLWARNFSLGIYFNLLFFGIRTKFMDTFIDFEEIRLSDNRGTVNPKQLLEMSPFKDSKDEQAMLKYLSDAYERYHHLFI